MKSTQKQQQTLNHALQMHGSGRLGEAEKVYRELLSEDPGQADALHYLGVIALQMGRFEQAAELIQRALDSRPDYVDALVNLGNALNSLGRYETAVAQFERALAIGPPTAPLLANLGNALAQLGRNSEAVKRYTAALDLKPNLAETRRSLADALLNSGHPTEAHQQIMRALADGPASIAMQVSLGNILHANGRSPDAVRCFEAILKTRPELVPVRTSLANVLRQTGRLAESIEHYEQALARDPRDVESHHSIGLAYQDLGRKDQALIAFRKAVELDPTCAKAWHGISAVSKDAFDDNEVETLLKLEQSTDILPEERMRLGFALGRHFENSGQHDKAAEQYLMANPLRRAVFDYDIDNDMLAIDNICKRFDTAYFDRWSAAGVEDSTPIFILGMPRSGTTLVEQILASHPRVFGAGELTLLARSIIDTFPMPDGVDYTGALENATPEKFQKIARNYVAGLPNAEADFVTDKLPHNFLNIGMIRILLPNAAIIHCRRDPRDTCFSIYKHLFGAYGHFYAYDLEELGRYYNGYAKLMRHWENVLPGVMHTVQYETMIDNQEQTTRELLDACGLDWDPACLEYYKLDRPVATLSASQVRQPVYRGSIGAWRSYATMLKPLLDILDDDGGGGGG